MDKNPAKRSPTQTLPERELHTPPHHRNTPLIHPGIISIFIQKAGDCINENQAIYGKDD
jgi:hypothetical protein